MEQCPINMRVVKSQLSHSLGALALLAEAGRGARVTDLAERLEAPKSNVQRLLQQLIGGGWVEQAAGKCGEQAEDQADTETRRLCQQRNFERDARSIDHARVNVAPDVIRPKQVGGRRRCDVQA